MAAVQAKSHGQVGRHRRPRRASGRPVERWLGFTDTGNKAVIGGLRREFYHRIWQHYQQPDAWKWQKREEYGNKGQGTPAIDGAQRTMWIFEPHVAEQVFEDLVARARDSRPSRRVARPRERRDGSAAARIMSITHARAARRYRREDVHRRHLRRRPDGRRRASTTTSAARRRATYGETWNGVQTGVLHHRHHFGVLPQPISPYVVPGDPASGVLPRISTAPPGEYGAGRQAAPGVLLPHVPDRSSSQPHPVRQARGLRPASSTSCCCASSRPAGGRPSRSSTRCRTARPTRNNHGPFSTDNIGFNYDYPEASYERRREILQEHETYQQGWLYFIANDPRVPADVRDAMRKWGLPKDEFTDNGGWPHQIYVREARRMVGRVRDDRARAAEDGGRRPNRSAWGRTRSTRTTCSATSRRTGYVQNEGDIGVALDGPYEIAYGSLVPKRGQASNLLVPVCVSSSHIAFGSIRMEPVFMILGAVGGDGGGDGASMAALAVQDVPYRATARAAPEGRPGARRIRRLRRRHSSLGGTVTS